MNDIKKLLVVDDDATILTLLSEFFSRSGYHVITADNGLSALKKTREDDYHAIITDIAMPTMDGFAFHKALAATDSPHAERVIFMSADLHNTQLGYLRSVGRPFVEKPFSLIKLRKKIEEII